MKFVNPLLFKGSQSAYAGDLSKSVSVTPERHSGFFVPVNCATSQVKQPSSARPAAALRLQSVYDGWTSQNKPAMANMWGGSYRPRVTPVTHSDTQPDWVHSQNCKECTMTKNTQAPIYVHAFADAAALNLEALEALSAVLQCATEPTTRSKPTPVEFAAMHYNVALLCERVVHNLDQDTAHFGNDWSAITPQLAGIAATSKSLRAAWLGQQELTSDYLQVAIIHLHCQLAGEALGYINNFFSSQKAV